MSSSSNGELDLQARRLGLFNNIVLSIAFVVYAAILYSAIAGGEWFAFVPLTSVLLGVLLIHFSVRVLLSHLRLIREISRRLN